MNKKFVDFAVLLGVDMKCEEELLKDFGFFMATEMVCDKLDAIIHNIENNIGLANAIDGLKQFKLDLKGGIEDGWLEADCSQKCSAKADKLIEKAETKLAMGEAIGILN